MRRMRVIGSALGVLVMAAACATTTATSGSPRYDATPQIRHLTAAEFTAIQDSSYAQAIADAQGPPLSIYAQFSNVAGSRRVRAVFHLDADAYVIVGQIDASGVMRIVFPVDPRDDGLVRGAKTYQTQEFFAGFTEEYRWRAKNGPFGLSGLNRGPTNSDAYDGRLGYVFAIASWRPMRFDRFMTDGRWDSFELADAQYMRDPRPAIYELASLLVGETREAYTVKFARYTSTQQMYAGYGSMTSAYGVGYCAGYEPFGFGLGPFGAAFDSALPLYGSSSFDYRGSRYFYDSGGDCYRSNPGYYLPGQSYGYGYRVAGAPTPSNPTIPKRSFNPEGGPRSPIEPRVVAPHSLPTGRVAETPTVGDKPAVSPQYRQRGLITSDDGGLVGPGSREPRVETRGVATERQRPTIQEMVNRRPTGSDATADGWSRPQAVDRPADRANREPYTPPTRRVEQSNDAGTRYTPSPRDDAARATPPMVRESPPVTREPVVREAPQRFEPRSAPSPEPMRASPPSVEPRSQPVSSPPPSAPPANPPSAPPVTGSRPPPQP